MIRTLHILWSARFGGIAKIVLDLTSLLPKENIQTAIMFGQEDGFGEFIVHFEQARLNCVFLGLNSGFDLSPRKYMRAIRIFREYDILHFHSFNPWIALCAVAAKKKIVYSEHGNFGFGRRKRASDPLKQLLLKKFLRAHIDFITFNSDFSRQLSAKRYRLAPVEKATVCNGIHLTKHSERPAILENALKARIVDQFVVGTISRFASVKRIDRLIQAFADFHLEKETLLLLVGDGTLRGDLEYLVSELGLAERTVFTGFVKTNPTLQRLMDVCVLPSENEAFGLVAVEMLSLGIPTIVFRNGGGLTEIIGGISPDDIVDDLDALVNRLNFYYFNREEIANEMVKRQNYSKKYDIEEMAFAFKRIYQRVLSCAA